jgi:hypothetical protein
MADEHIDSRDTAGSITIVRYGNRIGLDGATIEVRDGRTMLAWQVARCKKVYQR